jgi:hypothetical protein
MEAVVCGPRATFADLCSEFVSGCLNAVRALLDGVCAKSCDSVGVMWRD